MATVAKAKAAVAKARAKAAGSCDAQFENESAGMRGAPRRGNVTSEGGESAARTAASLYIYCTHMRVSQHDTHHVSRLLRLTLFGECTMPRPDPGATAPDHPASIVLRVDEKVALQLYL